MSFLTSRIRRDFLASCAAIRHGQLHLTTPEGERHHFGADAPEAEMAIHDWAAIPAIAARGDIGLGETYVAGQWDSGSIENLIELALLNQGQFGHYTHASFWNTLKFRFINSVMRANSRRGASRNIMAHYDVGNEFYQLWLDDSMTYSSAIFVPGDEDLERGQMRKYDRILDRIGTAERILEVGCGWGGFAERAADQGRHVTGLTISPSQKGYADARLDGRAEIRLQDYRNSAGKYDAIVSIEMIEAVGERYWPTYFAMLKDRLAEGGRAVIQAITVPDAYFPTYRRGSDYIRHYTFPGGMLLCDRVIADQAAQAELKVTQSHGFGRDYGRTCEIWRDRIDAEERRIRKLGYGDAFLRNWRFYLGICAGAFAAEQTDVVQVELAHA